MLKMHLGIGYRLPGGTARTVCGHDKRDVTLDATKVTCASCRRTALFRRYLIVGEDALKEAPHNWRGDVFRNLR